jgi:transcriptional regulator with XRE-family HTH domain
MPAKLPDIGDLVALRLMRLGERLRAHRKALKVSATTAAEAAGMSRVTWHRIERGEPSVTMGAYLGALAALGLGLEMVGDATARPAPLPATIALADYPALRALAWQVHEGTEVTPAQALALYERNWRHLDRDHMAPHERDLLRALVDHVGGGRALV